MALRPGVRPPFAGGFGCGFGDCDCKTGICSGRCRRRSRDCRLVLIEHAPLQSTGKTTGQLYLISSALAPQARDTRFNLKLVAANRRPLIMITLLVVEFTLQNPLSLAARWPEKIIN